MPRTLTALAAIIALPLAGCFGPRPADPPLPAPNTPPPQAGPIEAPMPPGTSAGEAEAATQREKAARLVADLDSQDPDRVYTAATLLLVDWASQRTDSTPLRAIAQRLQSNRVEQQRKLVKAIGQYTTYPGPTDEQKLRTVGDLVPLLEPFLGHSEERLRRDAIDSLAILDALDAEDPATDPVDQLIRRLLTPRAKPAPSPEAQRAAVRLIGQKWPKRAVPRLIEVVEAFPRSAELRAVAFEELYAATGLDFGHNLQNAKNWWEANREKPPQVWIRERFKKLDEEKKQLRAAAKDLWLLHTASLEKDPKLFAWLRDSLSGPRGEGNPLIRAEAAAHLARIPEGFDVLVEALASEKDAEPLRAILGAIATLAAAPPERDREALAKAHRAIVPLVGAFDRDVRIAGAESLAALGLEEGIRPIVERLYSKDRDPDVGIALLKSLGRFGAKFTPRVFAEVNRFLRTELDRLADPSDPLRDLRLLGEAAARIAALAERKDTPPPVEEAAKALQNLSDLLRYKYDEPSSNVAVNTRQYAALALGRLGMTAALPVLYERLSDKVEPDEGVALFTATAIGEISSGPETSTEERVRAVARLREGFETRREARTKEAAFKAIQAVLKADPTIPLSVYEELSEKLAQAGEPIRVARLLECLPATPAAGTEARYYALREKQARAYEAAKEFRSAVDVWHDLAARDPRHALAHANALVLIGRYDEADKIYVERLQKAASADVPPIWVGRQSLLRKLVDAGENQQAVVRGRLMLQGTGPLAPPTDVAQAIRLLIDQAGGNTPVGTESGGTLLPGSFDGGQGGSGGARPAGERRR